MAAGGACRNPFHLLLTQILPPEQMQAGNGGGGKARAMPLVCARARKGQSDQILPPEQGQMKELGIWGRKCDLVYCEEVAAAWGTTARVEFFLLLLLALAVAILVVMLLVSPCVGSFLVLSVAGAAAIAWLRRTSLARH
jgi:hypothetical protein